MTDAVFIALFLQDGRPLALSQEELAAALRRGADLGLGATAATTALAPARAVERWLTSRELAALTGVSDTWWEGAAARGEVPHMRAGKSLRFRLSDVEQTLKARHAVTRTARHG